MAQLKSPTSKSPRAPEARVRDSHTRLRAVRDVLISELAPVDTPPRAELYRIASWIGDALKTSADGAAGHSAMVRGNVSDPNDADSGTHKARRSSGGARREASERVLLRRGNEEITGWTLNVSRGGVRIIVEDPLTEGDEVEVQVGDEGEPSHPARVVWIKEQADGQIVGVQYLDVEGSIPPSQPPPPMD
ncbi:MAG: PilZ domain-containing protein [Polyangiaceae bacterium]